MMFSQARGLPVVTLGEANEIGVVESLVLDAGSGTVSHARISGARGRKETAIPWSAFHAFGPDAVLVRSDSALDSAVDSAVPAPPAPHDALRARVLTEDGDERGTVKDISFDPATGRVEKIYSALGEIPGDRLLGLGDYALVVRTG
ncbi:PRC-barrel domain-containing protein [Streptomyces sp. NPDC005551]|uniref:PRC-barrel domain-containing protein n=1 Tax=unclassified Streptomyces TaxID=2593676 RepID=UPI0033CDC5C9